MTARGEDIPKTAKFGPKYAFLVILGQILVLLPPEKNRIFGPKTAIFAPKYVFLGTRPCRLIWCPVGCLVGGCGAQAYLVRHLFT